MNRKQQLIELMNTIYNPLDEVNARNEIITIVDNMTEKEAYKHWLELRKWAKENNKLPKNPEVFINDFARYLLTTEKEFLYVTYWGSIKKMKRSKVLSKWFRNDLISGFVYVMEDEASVFFSDESTEFACKYMDDDLI